MLDILLNPFVILPLLIIFISLMNIRRLPTEQYTISKIWKITTILTILISLPVIIYTIYVCLVIFYVNNTDYWYQKSAKSVNFHLYKIIPPQGLIVDSIYKGIGKMGSTIDNAIVTAVNTPFKDQISGKTSFLVVKQIGVKQDFEIEKFLSEAKPASSSVDLVQISLLPTNTKGYLQSLTSKINFHYSGSRSCIYFYS